MKTQLTLLFLVHAIAAFKPPTIEVEEHYVQEHGNIGRFVELNEHDRIVFRCSGQFDDLEYTFPNMNEHAHYDKSNFEDRVEESIDEAFNYAVLTINDLRESDTGTYSCTSVDHSSLNDTIHLFVHGSNIFVPLQSVMFMYEEGDLMVPCKTTKFIDNNDIELFANGAIVKSASKNYDQRYGFKITPKIYDEKPIQNVQFECRYKKDPNQGVDYIITEKDPSSENDYQFYWEESFDWPHVGYNYSITCHLSYNGSKGFNPHVNSLLVECPQCSSVQGSRAFADRDRLNGRKITATVRIEHLELEDSGKYRCIWMQENKEDKIVDYILHVAPKTAQIKVVERSPQVVRGKEHHPTSLFAKFAIYPTDQESYTAKWSRMYNSSIKRSIQSEIISSNDFRTISTETLKNGVFLETLNIKENGMSTDMSGTYILSISHLDTVQVVQWEVAIENDKPDVQITVREPYSFIVFDQQFYPPNTHLHIECISISLPPADVIFEYRTDSLSPFQEIDQDELTRVEGTFEIGEIYNVTLEENLELRCSSARHKKRSFATKIINLADEALRAYSVITKSARATKSEDKKVIYEGDSVKLICVVPIGADHWDVSWRFENAKTSDISTIPTFTETISVNHSNHVVLHLREVTNAVSGEFTCVVAKEGESEKVSSIRINVETPLKPYHTGADSRTATSVYYDQTFVLDCNLTGNPAPEYNWYKDGHPYNHGRQNGSLLIVERSRAEDDGNFHCLATNRAGSTSHFIEVQVDGAPIGSFFFSKIALFIFIIFVGLLIFLAYKLHVSKKVAKQKDIALINLYETMIKHQAGPLPEEMKELPIEERTYYLPYNTDYEIDPVKLEILEPLGSGHFGVVRKGLLEMADPKSQIEYKTRLPVAVKSSTNPYNVELQRMMAEELKVMCAIPKHPNVLALIGAVTANMRKGQLYIVTEYIDGGNLREFLNKHRNAFKNELVDVEDVPIDDSYMVPNSVKKKKYRFDGKSGESDQLITDDSNSLCTSDLLSIGLQVANGMEWLANVPCVHRDLACRNILITKSKIVRIADFGLAKKHTNKTYYRTKKSKDTPIPVRWMPLEAIENQKFTQKSDIWSFGICLYEIFTLGGNPYPSIDNFNIISYVREGKRNEQPEYCHDDIYELMKMCWQASPKDRPTFSECINLIKNHMEECASELLQSVDNMLRIEGEEQLKLNEWIQKSRPNVNGTGFRKSPKKSVEERYLIVESHA